VAVFEVDRGYQQHGQSVGVVGEVKASR
jgi:hypothetical protein